MMINRISGSIPHSTNNNPLTKRNGFTTDTITFTASSKNLTQLTNDAFKSLYSQRKGERLGEVLGTAGKTNFRLKETLFGKKAELDIVRGDEFATFEISRNTNETPKIKELSDASSKNLVQLIQRFVKGLK